MEKYTEYGRPPMTVTTDDEAEVVIFYGHSNALDLGEVKRLIAQLCLWVESREAL